MGTGRGAAVGIGVGAEVDTGLGVYVGMVGLVAVGGGVGNTRAAVGSGVSVGITAASRFSRAKAGESAVVAGGSDANGHDFPIVSVNIASA